MERKNKKGKLMSIKQDKSDIEQAMGEAIKVLAIAAENATKTLANAAESATKVIANSAAEAAKVVNIKNSDDHDLLIELRTKMDNLKTDIKELTDGTSKRIADLESGKLDSKNSYYAMYKHGIDLKFDDQEIRIRNNSDKITKILTWGSAILIFIGLVQFAILVYIKLK